MQVHLIRKFDGRTFSINTEAKWILEYILQKCYGRNTEIIKNMYNEIKLKFMSKNTVFLIIFLKLVSHMLNIADSPNKVINMTTETANLIENEAFCCLLFSIEFKTSLHFNSYY